MDQPLSEKILSALIETKRIARRAARKRLPRSERAAAQRAAFSNFGDATESLC